MTITHYSEFAGVGGTSSGADAVPGVETIAAANHDQAAVDSHALNFPDAEHYKADITTLPIDKMPWCHLFTASPSCPAWTTANGVRRDFDRVNAEPTLFEVDQDEDPELAKRREQYRRSRLLMREIPRYLRAQAERGRPVPIGWMENVIQCRLWAEWDTWIDEIHKLGYQTRVIALNSMHAQSVHTQRAPQSRDRLYLAFWHRSIGRTPDWDKWLRPRAWCPICGTTVAAMQVFKRRGIDMGRYDSQYTYHCPSAACHHTRVHPEVLPALAAIDPTIPGIRIGDRARLGMPALADATMGRISIGVQRYWLPLLVPAGGTWRKQTIPLTEPMPARTCTESDDVALQPLLVPVEGRPGKTPASAVVPMRTQTCRNETGIALPFIAPLRGGGDKLQARTTAAPLSTVTAEGNHHGLALPPLVMRNNTPRGQECRCTPITEPLRTITAQCQQSLLVPYYGAADSAVPATDPVGTLTTHDRYGLAQLAQMARVRDFEELDLDDVLFRMLEVHEIAAAMAFPDGYRTVAASKRTRVRLYGNAVTPPAAEVITSALVECLTGEDLPREAAA